MGKYAYIVAADVRYLAELVANLNSLDFVGNTFDVHLIGYQIPQEVLDQFPKLNYNVIHHNITEEEREQSKGLSEVVCRKRYWYAAEIGKDYDAVCILDADLIWTRNPFQYFEMAAKTGFILGPSKEQNKVYDDPHHQFNGEWMIPEGYYNQFDMCNCPVFLDTKVWNDALRKSWEWFITGFDEGTNFKAPDMDAMNVAFIKYGGEGKIVVLPGIQWLGTNEQMLKPYMRAVEDRGRIKTESGIPIFCYHGQYYYKHWRENQLANRNQCAQGYLKAKDESLLSSNNIASGSMNLLYENFRRMLDHKIQIEKINYRHTDRPYDE